MADRPAPRRRRKQPAGVVEATPSDFLVIGRVARPWGLRGDLKAVIFSDVPDRFTRLEKVYVGRRPYRVRRTSVVGNIARLVLAGVTSREAAEALRDQLVEIPIDAAEPLPPDTYYHFQIVGLRAITETGEEIGTVAEVLPTGANDVYLVRTPTGREVPIPAIGDVVDAIDLAAGELRIRVVPGLLPDPPSPKTRRHPPRGARRPSETPAEPPPPTDPPD